MMRYRFPTISPGPRIRAPKRGDESPCDVARVRSLTPDGARVEMLVTNGSPDPGRGVITSATTDTDASAVPQCKQCAAVAGASVPHFGHRMAVVHASG